MKQENIKNFWVEAIYVCLTSFQYVVADLMARENHRKNRVKAIIILKYVSGVTPADTEYARYITISKGKLGKLKTLWFSLRPVFWWYNRDLYFFNDRDPITKNIAKWCGKRILVEEGLGTYFATSGIDVIGSGILPDEAYVGYPELYQRTHQGKCKVNKIMYASLFSKDNIRAYVRDFSYRFSCDILLLGQTTDTTPEYRKCENQFLMEVTRRFPDKMIIGDLDFIFVP